MRLISTARPSCSEPRLFRLVSRFLWLAPAALLAGCASTIADLPSPIGLPAGTPERPAAEAAYPAVHDMPPPRSTEVLSQDEQKKAEEALIAARNRQTKQVNDAAKDQ